MKNLFLTKTRWVVTIIVVTILSVGNVWAEDETGTITFGNSGTKIDGTSVSGDDDLGNTWTITTVFGGNTSFTQSTSYSQVGSKDRPATSITFTTTLPASHTIKAFSAKFGGFSNTTGNVTLKVGSTIVGSGSLSGTSDVTVTASNTTTAGTVLTVTVTSIDRGVKCYWITYSYEKPVVPVSSVSVDPTSKAIVPGETFTITPTVLPANATDKTVSWSSSATGKATVTSAGVVTGVAAGSATITCTTTSGSKTATCAVTVYGVTLQAKDENGDAIATATPGVPSRTGASISPAANANNYVFKEWAVTNASLGSSATTASNTITNPTGAVTVTAKYYKPRQVIWMVNGEEWTPADHGGTNGTSAVGYNTQVSTLPTAPTPAEGCAGSDRFMGWTTTQNYEANTPPGVLFTTAGASPAVTAATQTFYAVFADYAE